MPPYSDEQGGFVCNLAIARYATVRVRATSDEDGAGSLSRLGAVDSPLAEAAARRAKVQGVSIDLRSDYPVGAGLGGSSAAGVAMLGALRAWRGETIEPASLAEASRALEVEDLGIAGGRQDHYAAAVGGALGLTFGDGVTVERIALGDRTVSALERQCMVIYTGSSRISGATITAVLDAYRAREPRVTQALEAMKRLAMHMRDALTNGDVDTLGALVGEHWAHQRALHSSITTPTIDEIMTRATRAGACGAKALGASGGGCVLVIAPEERVREVRDAVAGLGEELRFTVARMGVEVVGGEGAQRPAFSV